MNVQLQSRARTRRAVIPAGRRQRRHGEPELRLEERRQGRNYGRWTFGLGFFSEGGQGSDYGDLRVDNALLGGAGIEEIEHSSQFNYMIFAPAASVRFGRHWAFGIAPQIGYGDIEMSMPLANPRLQRFEALDIDGASDFAFRLKTGLLYDHEDTWGIGIAYTTAASLDMDGGHVAIHSARGDPMGTSGDAALQLGWPQSVKVGAFVELGRFTAQLLTRVTI